MLATAIPNSINLALMIFSAYCCAWKQAILKDLNPNYLDSSRILRSSFAASMKSADASLCIYDFSRGRDLMHEGIFPALVTDIIVIAQHE